MATEDLSKYLAPTYFFDFESKEIQELVREFEQEDKNDKQKAIALYNKVRDQWWYNPFAISFQPQSLRASHLFHQKSGHCVDKSILLIAGLRRMGIPARLHLAKVKNHIAVESLMEKLGSNELTPHGMVDVYLNRKWVKVSPAFNKELCSKYNVDVLDFNGENDSIFHEYDKADQRFMEYLEDYGHFEDVPVDFIIKNMRAHYPALFETGNFLL